MRIRAIIVFILMTILFWLPMVFAIKRTACLAIRWIKDDASGEYEKWFKALLTCITVIMTGRKASA